MIDFKGLKIDALLVSSLANVRYLTGFTGSNGLALLMPERITLITDPRYTIQAQQEVQSAKLACKVEIAKKRIWDTAVQRIQRRKLKRVGFEGAQISYESYESIQQDLPLGYALTPVGAVIEELRMVKTGDEIEHIRRSVNTNSEAFESVAKTIREGVTESQIAADLDYQMRKRGAEGSAFETIVASGARTALPHARPTSQAVGKNELILIDMGSARDGYMSDMTRMLFLGSPGRKIRAMYRAVLEAQLAAAATVREGVMTRQVDGAARRVLEKANLGKAFVHSTGHGLGLEIHEAPRVGKTDRTRLKAGMVITIEPGAYVEGVGGMRVEDTVLVTKTGCEVLTPTSKELMVL